MKYLNVGRNLFSSSLPCGDLIAGQDSCCTVGLLLMQSYKKFRRRNLFGSRSTWVIFLLESEDLLLATQRTPLPVRQILKIYICENNDVALVHVKSLGHTLLDMYLEQFDGIFLGSLEHQDTSMTAVQ